MVNPLKSLKSKLSRNNKGDKGKNGAQKQEKVEIDNPQDFDILLGRGKTSFNHVGNRRFRVFINLHLRRYMDASSRMEKTMVVNSVVEAIHEAGGRFLKQDLKTGKWHQVNTKMAREKVGHALRDAVGMRLKLANSGGNNNSNSSHSNLTINSNVGAAVSILSKGGSGRERRKSDIALERAKRNSVVERPTLLLPQAQYRFSSKSCNDVTIEPTTSGMAADARKALLELQQESLNTDDEPPLDPIPIVIPTEMIKAQQVKSSADDATDVTPRLRNSKSSRQHIPNRDQARKVFESAALSFGTRRSDGTQGALESAELSIMSDASGGKWFGSGEFSLASVDSKVFEEDTDLMLLKEQVAKTLNEEFPETRSTMGPSTMTALKMSTSSKKSKRKSDIELSEEFSTMSIDMRNSGKSGVDLAGTDPFNIKSEEFGLKSDEFQAQASSNAKSSSHDAGAPVITNMENITGSTASTGSNDLDLLRLSSTEFSLRSKDFLSLRTSGVDGLRSSSKSTNDLLQGSSSEFVMKVAKAANVSFRDSGKRGGEERLSLMSGIHDGTISEEEVATGDRKDAKTAAV